MTKDGHKILHLDYMRGSYSNVLIQSYSAQYHPQPYTPPPKVMPKSGETLCKLFNPYLGWGVHGWVVLGSIICKSKPTLNLPHISRKGTPNSIKSALIMT